MEQQAERLKDITLIASVSTLQAQVEQLVKTLNKAKTIQTVLVGEGPKDPIADAKFEEPEGMLRVLSVQLEYLESLNEDLNTVLSDILTSINPDL